MYTVIRTKNAHMVKKCARPGMDHLSSLAWPATSRSWVSIRVLMSEVRSAPTF
nr:hypothetical protein CPGR_04135 [Mycolicibacter nonchromogenicus]